MVCYAAIDNWKQQATPGGLVAVSTDWKSREAHFCLVHGWGALAGIRHRGRQHQLEQEDCRVAVSGSDYMCNIPCP